MELALAKGVNAHIQQTKKFKTIIIEYKFRTAYQADQATARTLLKNMMVTNTKTYTSQKLMDQHMSWLYGASLSSSSQRYGSQHVVTLRLKLVNDKFIGGDNSLLEAAFDFMREIIFNPNVQNQTFHAETFNRERLNLKNYFESLEENKSAYARYRLNQLLFEGTDQIHLGIGNSDCLELVTEETLYQTYLNMIQQDTTDIFVSGDVDYDRISAILQTNPFEDRQVSDSAIFIRNNEKNDVNKQEEASDVNQGKLLFGFSSNIYFGQDNHYAAMVFNGLFGGFPHSKLFQNVREKESLAYSASSSLDNLRGKLVVSTGIDFAKREMVETIVLEQLADMQNGDFSDSLINQTKEMLINHYKQNDDNQGQALAKIYTSELLLNRQIAEEEWIEALMAVTKDDIISVAKNMKLEAVFFLKGEEADA